MSHGDRAEVAPALLARVEELAGTSPTLELLNGVSILDRTHMPLSGLGRADAQMPKRPSAQIRKVSDLGRAYCDRHAGVKVGTSVAESIVRFESHA